MRKFIGSLLATMFMVMTTSVPAMADTTTTMNTVPKSNPTVPPGEQTTVPSRNRPTVECHMVNRTDPSVKNPDGTHVVNRPVDIEVVLNDPHHIIVGHIVFQATQNNVKGGVLDSGPETTWTFTPIATGNWRVVVDLFDLKGNPITHTGDCDIDLTVVADSTPPVTELALTGSGTRNLAIIGFTLVLLGMVALRKQRALMQ